MNKNFYNNDINEIINGISDSKYKLDKKKILLVGSNGFLGKYFLECLMNMKIDTRRDGRVV